MEKERVTVSIEFQKGLSVSFETEGKTDEQILEEAKKLVIKQLEEKFPSFVYGITKGNALTFDNAKQGTVVKSKNSDELFIVTNVNKKTVDVANKEGIIYRGHPLGYTLENVKSSEVVWGRPKHHKEVNSWYEGDTGYVVVTENKKQVAIPVVVGASKGQNTKLFIINGKGSYYTLNDIQKKKFLFDTKQEADTYIKKTSK